jgi:hypothetical protein
VLKTNPMCLPNGGFTVPVKKGVLKGVLHGGRRVRSNPFGLVIYYHKIIFMYIMYLSELIQFGITKFLGQ